MGPEIGSNQQAFSIFYLYLYSFIIITSAYHYFVIALSSIVRIYKVGLQVCELDQLKHEKAQYGRLQYESEEPDEEL